MKLRHAVLVLGATVLLVSVAGAAGGGEPARIVFVSKLPMVPVPPNLNVPHLYSVGADGRGRRDLGAASTWIELSPDRATVAVIRGGELWVLNADGSGQRRLLAPPPGQQFSSFKWAPDGRKLAALSSGEVWLTNLDGSGQRQLVTAAPDAAWENDLSWSPDGLRVAIGSISGARAGPTCQKYCVQWLVDIVGVGGNRIRSIPDARHTAWSPDGKRIALEQAAFAQKEDSRVVVRRADGSAPRTISDRCVQCSGCWSYPTWSPDGKRISFISDECDEVFTVGAVVIVRSTGPTRARVIPAVYNPSWSPDGSRFTFFRGCSKDVAGNSINCTLFSAAADGSGPRRLARGEPFFGAVWSPDGRRFALVSARDAYGHGQIFQVNAVGGGRRQITHEPPSSASSPGAWSRDGRRLFYISTVTEADSEIWTMGLDGSDLRQVTSNGLEDSKPVWSPDRRRIAFSRWSAPTKKGLQTEAIYTISPNGSGEKLVVGGPRESDSAPTWSPDGRRLAFVRANGGADVFLADPDGGNVRRLTSGGRSVAPAWSPDGTEIVFIADGMVSLIRPDGTGARPLTPPAQYSDPAWSPDGTQIAVASGAGISVISYPDGNVRLVVAAPGASSPSWSPDGRQLVYAGTSDIQACLNDGRFCAQTTIYVVDTVGGKPTDLTPFFGVDSREPYWFGASPR